VGSVAQSSLHADCQALRNPVIDWLSIFLFDRHRIECPPAGPDCAAFCFTPQQLIAGALHAA